MVQIAHDAGESGGKYVQAEVYECLFPISDGSGKTNTKLKSGDVALQISIRGVKFTNSKGNNVPLVINHTLPKSELLAYTKEKPLVITTNKSGQPLPLSCRVVIGGSPSKEQKNAWEKKKRKD